jgi:HD-GYP domain-containing protein (c-di-GMP phosphodiesterase class II)
MASSGGVLSNAKDIINQLGVIIRNAAIHDPNNVAVTSAIEKFIAIVNPAIFLSKGLTLELRGEFFYLNDERVRYSLEFLQNFDFLAKEFKKRSLGSIAFQNSVRSSDMLIFIKAFIGSIFSQEPFEALHEGISSLEYISIDKLKKIQDEKVDSEVFDIRKEVKRSYFSAVSYTKGVINKIKSGEKISIKKAKRVVESMVDLIIEEEQLLVGMTAIKDYDEYTYHHSVNVSILSVALGQRLGLSKKALTDLGMVSLFHDIGKVEIPADILNKPTSFTDDEWDIVKKHPYWGFRALLRLRGLEPTSVRSAISAFEHHMNYDFSGYPKIKERLELDFYSKIISLADQYDGMTSSRVYSRVPIPPDRALSIMMERAGTQLDPVLFKFFINMVGVFPVGTLVMLDTKELGLVYQCDSAYLDRPKILVILNSKGERVQNHIVDLIEKDSEGRYMRSIVKTLDPNKYRINLAEFLM